MTDLDAIRARHVPSDEPDRDPDRVWCDGEGYYGPDWPCDTAVVLAALDATLDAALATEAE